MRDPPGEIENWLLYTESKYTLKKDANHSKLVGSRFNKEEGTYIPMKLVLGISKMNRSLYLPNQNLKVYVEALIGFSDVHSLDGLNNTLLSRP